MDERGPMRRLLPWAAVSILAVVAAWLLLREAKTPRPAAEDVAGALEDVAAPRSPTPRLGATTDAARRGSISPARSVRPVRAAASGATKGPRESRGEVEPAEESGPPDVAAREYIEALRESGEATGLAAFPLPGTRPPRPGVIVPDDYELPEGFARHYQTTDDGRPLAPILVVAPGYELVDEDGRPFPLADDRIVPPELAPPDLPVHVLDVPHDRRAAEGDR